MSAQDFQPNPNGIPIVLDGNFTTEEAARLQALRENLHEHTEYQEGTLDERRIAFARWLIETGRLRESL
jgi:hypothetical protein